MSDTIEVPCVACGNPVTLERPNTGDPVLDRLYMRIARQVSHTACFQQASHARQLREATLRLQQRANKWSLLCEPFYQSSHEWIQTAAAGRKINLRAHQSSMAWEYGERGLFLYGCQSGTGKTTTAWLLLKREFMGGRMIVAMSHGEFTRMATLLARENNRESLVWAKTVAQCDLLFIDDLGKSRFQTGNGDGKAAEEFLFELINDRISGQRPCLFTSNSNGQDLAEKMSQERSEPFLRRLREFCLAVNFDK
ncbi:MAG: ATP-binding protein [Patescibacteria group bacterium]|nr:ATP-binding protein [Patescibacteria group bacterium]